MLNGISTNGLQRAFRSWIERVENVITAEGALCTLVHILHVII
jgi:hypothetical protein